MMKLSRWRLALAAAPLLVLSACSGLGEAMSAHTDVVARAAGKELKIDQMAELMAVNPEVPSDPQVVRALADVWVDYALLATALAEDSTLSAIDLNAFVEPAREMILIQKLHDEVTSSGPLRCRTSWCARCRSRSFCIAGALKRSPRC